MKNCWPDGRCRSCHSTERSTKALHEIRLKFRGAGELNERIFKTYLSDLDKMRLSPIDVKTATRLAETLAVEPLDEIKSWREAWRLAGRLNIRYSNQERYLLRRNDPVLRVARELERAGKIPADYRFSTRYEKALQSFEPETRRRVERYIDEDGEPEQAQKSKLNRAIRLRHFQRYLKGGDLFNQDPSVARLYFTSLKSRRVTRTHENLMHLRRFFRWSMKQGFSQGNPFENWYPEHLTRTCEKCRKTRRFTGHDRICDRCYAEPSRLKQRGRLERLVQSYHSPSSYNQHLLDLYVRYLKRYTVTAPHLMATQALIEMLQSRPLPAIRSWSDVFSLSEELDRRQGHPPKPGGPFLKIGRMLEELGVLPIRQTDKENQIANLIADCPEETARTLRRYSEHLLKMKHRNLSRYGTIRTIVEVQYWLTKHKPEFSLLTLNQEVINQYICALKDGDRSGIRRYILRRFYRWARSEKLTLMNPMDGLRLPKKIRKICVCTDSQIRGIESFVKNPKSNPEYALILTLGLYWGFSIMELATASIEIHDSQIQIILQRKPLSRGRRAHYRDQTLKLPLTPAWLAALQRRYIQFWRERFEQTPKDFPVQPLLLGKRGVGGNNRHLHFKTVMDLFYKAVIEATGSRIPPNIVRRTSAHIHTYYGDASRLAKLGWAQSHCHDFSIYPRTYFTS